MNVIPLPTRAAAVIEQYQDYLNEMVDTDERIQQAGVISDEDRVKITEMNLLLGEKIIPIILEETGVDLRNKTHFLRISLRQLEEIE